MNSITLKYTFFISFVPNGDSVIAQGDCGFIQVVCPHPRPFRGAHRTAFVIVNVQTLPINIQEMPETKIYIFNTKTNLDIMKYKQF